jgi:hypothetical protein
MQLKMPLSSARATRRADALVLLDDDWSGQEVADAFCWTMTLVILFARPDAGAFDYRSP